MTFSSDPIEVVAAVIERRGRILLARRDARIGKYIGRQAIILGERRIIQHAWHVPAFSGTNTLHCHSEFIWLPPATAATYALAPVDIPLLQAFICLR